MDGSKHRGDERNAGVEDDRDDHFLVCDDVHQGVGGDVDDDVAHDGVSSDARVLAPARRAETDKDWQVHRDLKVGDAITEEKTDELDVQKLVT